MLRSRVLLAARAEPSAARGVVSKRAVAALSFAVSVSLGLFLALGGIRTGPRPLGLIVGTSLGLSLIALAATWTAVSRARSMLGRSRLVLLSVAVMTPAVLFAWKFCCSALFVGMTERWPTRPGLKCFGLMLATAVLPLLALAFERRHTDPTHPQTLGVALASAVGACAAVLVDLWCPVAYAPHLLVGHVLPIFVLMVLGALLGKSVIAIR